MNSIQVNLLLQQVRHELCSNIMPFWLRYSPDLDAGGFIGRMSNDLVPDKKAGKGLVLNARLLWSFSSMYQYTHNQDCLVMADRAYNYLNRYFMDSQFGGAYWMLHPDGRPADASKKVYGQAFLIYALSEFYACTQKQAALEAAMHIFDLLDRVCLDTVHGGYFEVFDRDWTPATDQRLGETDLNEKKSMNTHLHLLEAFTRLCAVSGSAVVTDRLKMLIRLFTEKILNKDNGHFTLFFDEAWTPKSQTISFGHDIETAWLLCKAADMLNDAALKTHVSALAVRCAQITLDQAIDRTGGMCYEINASGLNRYKEFWAQAEAAVGFLNAWQLTRKNHFYAVAAGVWNFIRSFQVDKRDGEWFLRLDPDGHPVIDQPKISEWKDPYHNSRCCLELINRLSPLAQAQPPQVKTKSPAYEESSLKE